LLQAGVDLPRLQAHLGLPADIDTSAPRELPSHASLQAIMGHARELASLHGAEGSISTDHVCWPW